MPYPMKRSLLFVTGTRADFGKLEPLAAAARDAGHQVCFWVTGMHMMERYGLTKLEVARMQGVGVHEFENQSEGDPQDIILARTMLGFSEFVRHNAPDLVIIHGDRVEALACALVAATNYIRSAHIEGGEVSGTIDEMLRHCNSKLATYHFVSSEAAAQRLRSMGEDPESIEVIGSPELDFHAASSGVTLEEVRSRYEITGAEYGICTFHPVTSETGTMAAQADGLFSALEDSGRYFVVIAPNNDPGSDGIFARIERLPRERFRVLPSMRFAHFSELMKNAACIVGNSSAGVREAPFLGVPSLDVGTRQTNRSMAPSVFSVHAHDTPGIAEFLANQWDVRFDRHTGFGSGEAASRFVDILNDPQFWRQGMQKRFHDA